MTVRGSAILVFGLCLTPAFAHALPGRNAGNGQHPRRQQQGFGEYALGKINPGNADLGASYQTARDQLVHATIDDVYFWSNCISITLLIGVTGFCFLHLRASDKKERIAATLIAQLWNGRVSDKTEIERRTHTYNALVDDHNELVERSLTTQSVQRKIRSATKEEPEMEAPAIEMESATVEVPAPASMQVPLVEDFTPVEVPSRRGQPMRRPVEVAPSLQKKINPVDQQVMAQDQEIKRLRSQVQALQSREANLLVRINSQEELKNQNWKQTRETKARYSLLSLGSFSRNVIHDSEVLHMTEINDIRLTLLKSGRLKKWKNELQVLSENLAFYGETTKDYDAQVTVDTAKGPRSFGLEYERTAKSTARYRQIRKMIDEDLRSSFVLYLSPNQELMFLLAQELCAHQTQVVFGLISHFHREGIKMRVLVPGSQGNSWGVLEELLIANQDDQTEQTLSA